MDFQAGPPNGAPSKPPKQYSNILNRVAGCIWIGINGYLLYAFCYNIVWHHIRPKNKHAAIAILCVFSIVNFYLWMSFVAIHLWGPGKISNEYRKPSFDDPNAPFLCDERGYSFYCSECKFVKPNRTHHSSFTNSCVPVMDHLCPWIGNVVGQGNRKFFLQFVFAAMSGQIIVLVTLFVYQHNQVPHINGNSIAMYIVCGFVFLFTLSVFAQHFFYVLWSHTTLEHMQYKKYGGPFINAQTEKGRTVVSVKVGDVIMPRASPFDLGTWGNLIDVMGPVYTWPLPVRGPIYEPMIRKEVVDKYANTLNTTNGNGNEVKSKCCAWMF